MHNKSLKVKSENEFKTPLKRGSKSNSIDGLREQKKAKKNSIPQLSLGSSVENKCYHQNDPEKEKKRRNSMVSPLAMVDEYEKRTRLNNYNHNKKQSS